MTRINETVLYRHSEDAAFLWARRAELLRSTTKHAERVRLDQRLEGHLAALKVGADPGLRVALDAVRDSRRPGTLFAACVLAFARAGSEDAASPLWAIAAGRASAFSEIVSAVGWTDAADIAPLLALWSQSTDPWLTQLGIAGLAAHRCSPGVALTRGLRSAHAGVRAAAAKAVGQLGVPELVGALRELVADDDDRVRFQAARSAARFMLEPAVRDALLSLAEGRASSLAEGAAGTLAQVDPRDGVALVRRWGASSATRRLAIVAAEATGVPAVVPALVVWMNDDECARRAGDALVVITGVDLAGQDLTRPRPAFLAGDPTDDPDDPRVELGSDYLLPLPAPLRVAAWWRANADRFDVGQRYLAGRAIESPCVQAGTAVLERIARLAAPRCQALASAALGRLQRGRPTIETHAPATPTHALPGWEQMERRATSGQRASA